MTRRRRGVRLVVAVVLMGEIVRHLLSNEYGPLDRFLEISVVLLILYEIVSPHTLVRRVIRRKKLRRIDSRLRSLIASGETAKSAVPHWGDYYDAAWVESAKLWIADAEKYLISQSSEKALIEFRRMINLDNQQRKHISADGRIEWIGGPLGDTYQLLNVKLDNLQRIAVRCEDYF